MGDSRFRRSFVVAVLIATVSVLLLGAAQVAAATFSVNSTTDAVDVAPGDGSCATTAGVCTLRAAIQEANALSGSDTILLPAGTYVLTLDATDEELAASGDLDIRSTVVINGAAAPSTIIDGNRTDRVFHVHAGAGLTLNDVTVQRGMGGWPVGIGGGIYATEGTTLSLTRVVVRDNSLPGQGPGGGIAVAAASIPPIVIISESTITRNSTFVSGGGISVQGPATLEIDRSTISENTAGHGAGISLCNSGGRPEAGTTCGTAPPLRATITNSTISKNSTLPNGGWGGGLFAAGSDVTIVNTTMTGNTAESDGAAIALCCEIEDSLTRLINVTIASNSAVRWGGALQIRGSIRSAHSVYVQNTIISQNVGPAPTNCDVLVQGTIFDEGHNLEYPGNSCGFSAPTSVHADPLLGALTDNGGPTMTHALLAGSPALDAGDNALANAADLTTDQRGAPRTSDGPDADTTDTVDIGAFEARASLPVFADKIQAEGAGSSSVPFDTGDVDLITSVTATSRNTGLVPNLPPNLNLSGTAGARTLNVLPLPDAFGTATITVMVTSGTESMSDQFDLIVTPVADTPSITNATTIEDTQTTSGLVISRNAMDGAEVTHFKITAVTGGTLFENNGTTPIPSGAFITFAQGHAGLLFTPAANQFSGGQFTVQASLSATDAGLGGGTATAIITVTPVADTPSITNAAAAEETQTTSGLVISRNAADGAEVTHFKIANLTSGMLFLNDGTTPVANGAFITVGQGAAGLKFTPIGGFNGTGFVSVRASIGNTDAGVGSSPATASITMSPVADTPSITNAMTGVDTQTASGLVISRHISDGAEVTHFKITSITDGTLFQHDGVTPIATGAFITFVQGHSGLRFTPASDSVTTGHVSVQASVSASDAGLGGGIATANILVHEDPASSSQPPFGAFDTPANNAGGLAGVVAVTGWALDDVAVDRVEIWRDCVTVDVTLGACLTTPAGGVTKGVFIGRAVFVPGARSDVEQIFGLPPDSLAGWGYLMLTNALPHLVTGAAGGGQGSFTLSSYAFDGEGHVTLLGAKTITLDNDHATIPFGNLDTPDQGATTPGPAAQYNNPAAYPVFGWAMTQAGKCIDTSSPTSYRVYIDGVAQPLTPGTNWFAGLNRSDIAAAFPGLCNTTNGLAAFYMDVRPLSNGLHTIGWDVIDDRGNVAGIGSRFFIVAR